MTKEFIPYTYLIGWSDLDKWYYGAEYSQRRKIANPSNLWTIYFTSSKIVKEYREKYGEPDVVLVRKTFKNKDEATSWENRVLKKFNAAGSDKWLNRSNGNIDFDFNTPQEGYWKGKKNPKLSKALSGRPSPNKGKKTGPTGKPAWNSGKKCPQIGDATRGKPGRKWTEDQKEKQSETLMGHASPVKGKSYEEIYGIEKSIELKNSRKRSNSEREVTEETRKKQSLARVNSPSKGMLGISHTVQAKEKIGSDSKERWNDPIKKAAMLEKSRATREANKRNLSCSLS